MSRSTLRALKRSPARRGEPGRLQSDADCEGSIAATSRRSRRRARPDGDGARNPRLRPSWRYVSAAAGPAAGTAHRGAQRTLGGLRLVRNALDLHPLPRDGTRRSAITLPFMSVVTACATAANVCPSAESWIVRSICALPPALPFAGRSGRRPRSRRTCGHSLAPKPRTRRNALPCHSPSRSRCRRRCRPAATRSATTARGGSPSRARYRRAGSRRPRSLRSPNGRRRLRRPPMRAPRMRRNVGFLVMLAPFSLSMRLFLGCRPTSRRCRSALKRSQRAAKSSVKSGG